MSESSNIKIKLRRNKSFLFENERKDILNNIINNINTSKDGEYIFLIDLYNNDNLKKYIRDNLINIRKYYRCSSWRFFISENNNQNGDEITLLRSILKDHGYQIYRKDITAYKNNVKKRYTTILLIK